MPDRLPLRTPVAFFIFNRPETTARVFAAIAAARPPMLLVIADGPRPDRTGEAARCAQARSIALQVDWPCELRTLLAADNLGCKKRISSGIDWVFEQVEEAIFLEDDCLPHPDFFPYCDELLARYRHDDRIGMIGGTNFQFGQRADRGYYYSRYTHVWGWASWRRAWRHYDVAASNWPEFRASGEFRRSTVPLERAYWARMFEQVHRGRIDTWDYQWMLSCWSRSMLAVIPPVNLVSNLGFGADARSTRKPSIYAAMATEKLPVPLHGPAAVTADWSADARVAKGMFRLSWERRLRHWWRQKAASAFSGGASARGA